MASGFTWAEGIISTSTSSRLSSMVATCPVFMRLPTIGGAAGGDEEDVVVGFDHDFVAGVAEDDDVDGFAEDLEELGFEAFRLGVAIEVVGVDVRKGGHGGRVCG